MWRKKTPCRYYANGYCHHSAEKCLYGHFLKTPINRRSPSPSPNYSRNVLRSPIRSRRRSRSRSRSPRRRSRSRSTSSKRRSHARKRSLERASRSGSPRGSKRSPSSRRNRISSPRRHSPRYRSSTLSPALSSNRISRSPSVRAEASPVHFVSTYNDSFSPRRQPTPDYPVSEGIRQKQTFTRPLLPTPIQLKPNANLQHSRTMKTFVNPANNRKYILDNKLKSQLERTDFSLLGEVSEEIKHSFECWLWQKE